MRDTDVLDWKYRAEYIRSRSFRRPSDKDIEPDWANEAFPDDDALIEWPDPASKYDGNRSTYRLLEDCTYRNCRNLLTKREDWSTCMEGKRNSGPPLLEERS